MAVFCVCPDIESFLSWLNSCAAYSLRLVQHAHTKLTVHKLVSETHLLVSGMHQTLADTAKHMTGKVRVVL